MSELQVLGVERQVAAALIGTHYMAIAYYKDAALEVYLSLSKEKAIEWARGWCHEGGYDRDEDDVMVFATEVDGDKSEKVWDAWEEFK